MNEDDLRRLLQDAATDPGPPDSWSSFLRTAHRRRHLRVAAAGGSVAALLLVGAGVFAFTSGISLEKPKPAATETPREEPTPGEDLRRGDRGRGDDGADIGIGPGPRRGPRGERPPAPSAIDDAVDVADDDPPPRGDDPQDLAPVDPPETQSCGGRAATVTGTDGADRLRGTPGSDVIAAGPGDDVVNGAGGDDRICGGAGDDRIDGGPGFDFVLFTDSPGPVELYLREDTASGDGDDVIGGVEGAIGTPYDDWLEGDQFVNVLAGEGGADIMDGNAGEDIVLPGPGNDLVSGGVGRDTLAFVGGGWTPGRPGVQVDLRRAQSLGEGNDQVAGFERANGTPGDDVLSGHVGPNVFRGYAGDDTVTGVEGDDDLIGGPGSDKLDGGLGADYLSGGDGVDTCTNGESTEGCEAGTLGALLFVAVVLDRIRARYRKRQGYGV